MNPKSKLFAIFALTFAATSAHAGEWCTITGFNVTENSGSISVTGTLTGISGSSSKEWLLLDGADVEQTRRRLAVALAAQSAERSLLLYVADPYTCVTVPHWQAGVIIHIRML